MNRQALASLAFGVGIAFATPGFAQKAHVALDWLLTAVFWSDPVQLKVEDEHSAMGSSGHRRPPMHDAD